MRRRSVPILADFGTRRRPAKPEVGRSEAFAMKEAGDDTIAAPPLA
jgi:hypothetical protein